MGHEARYAETKSSMSMIPLIYSLLAQLFPIAAFNSRVENAARELLREESLSQAQRNASQFLFTIHPGLKFGGCKYVTPKTLLATAVSMTVACLKAAALSRVLMDDHD